MGKLFKCLYRCLVTMQNKERVDVKGKILRTIQNGSPQDFSIQELADMTSISRETVSKYVGILEAENKIKMSRMIGKAKMYSIS